MSCHCGISNRWGTKRWRSWGHTQSSNSRQRSRRCWRGGQKRLSVQSAESESRLSCLTRYMLECSEIKFQLLGAWCGGREFDMVMWRQLAEVVLKTELISPQSTLRRTASRRVVWRVFDADQQELQLESLRGSASSRTSRCSTPMRGSMGTAFAHCPAWHVRNSSGQCLWPRSRRCEPWQCRA